MIKVSKCAGDPVARLATEETDTQMSSYACSAYYLPPGFIGLFCFVFLHFAVVFILYETMRSESLPLLPPPEEAQSNENPLRTSTGIVTLLGCSMTMFCVNCIVSIVAPFFPQYAEKENGASQTIIGMIFAVYPLGVFLSSFFWAKTCKKIGKKMVLGLGLFILSLSTIGFGLCKEIYLYFIVRFIQGVGASAAGTASSVILMEAFPDNLGFSLFPIFMLEPLCIFAVCYV
eukprot:Pgem_evm1s18496